MLCKIQQFAVVFTLVTQNVLADSIEEEGAACTPDVHGSCALRTSASLLQKGVRHDVKSLKTSATQEQPLRAEDNLYDTVCTGTEAQGRCWFLSEMGESCSATCGRQGRVFSYAISDVNAPITPKLVNHEPKVKQEPWAALECYVPSEDRYHTANENAARHFVSDIGNWSHEACKLACPCGGPQEPVPPTQPTQNTCDWTPALGCVKEFDYQGAHYVGCTSSDHATPWCSHSDPYQGSWSHCSYSCANKEENKFPVRPVPAVEERCDWQPKPTSLCEKVFEYKGVQHTGCIDKDYPTPWCSLDRVHSGTWETCERRCVTPQPVEPIRPVEPIEIIRPAYPVPDPSTAIRRRPAYYPAPEPVPAAYPVPDPREAVGRRPAYYPAPQQVPRTYPDLGEP